MQSQWQQHTSELGAMASVWSGSWYHRSNRTRYSNHYSVDSWDVTRCNVNWFATSSRFEPFPILFRYFNFTRFLTKIKLHFLTDIFYKSRSHKRKTTDSMIWNHVSDQAQIKKAYQGNSYGIRIKFDKILFNNVDIVP